MSAHMLLNSAMLRSNLFLKCLDYQYAQLKSLSLAAHQRVLGKRLARPHTWLNARQGRRRLGGIFWRRRLLLERVKKLSTLYLSSQNLKVELRP